MFYFFKKNNIKREKYKKSNSTQKDKSGYVKIFKNKIFDKVKKDIRRFVKWPRYIRIQKEKKIFHSKLKVPRAIMQFSQPLDKNTTKKLIHILSNCKNNPDDVFKKNTIYLRHGINNAIDSLKKKKALFIAIANDVNPIELVIWLPMICQKSNIPFCITRNKSTLGKLLNKKSTSCVTISIVTGVSKLEMKKIENFFRLNFSKTQEARL